MFRAQKYLPFLLLVCSITTVVAQKGVLPKQPTSEIPELPEDFDFPTFTCDFQGQHPFIVSVRDKTAQKEHLCGGVLIAKDAVLTAAHCVDPRTSKKATITPDLYIGGVNSDEPIQKRKTVRAFPHPDWTGSTEDGNDIIILKLNKDTCASPIPTLGAKDAEDRDNLFFMGYGRTSVGGSFSFSLQASDFQTFNNSHCNTRYEIDPPLKTNDLCVRQKSSIGLCNGDDGGPLILRPTVLQYKDVLIGIASFATGECTETKGVAVFMDVYKYRKFIKKTLKSKAFKEA